VNPLERGSQVDFMADLQEMLDFPPAPKLDLFGKLDPAKATPAEMRGQGIFFGKGKCGSCHARRSAASRSLESPSVAAACRNPSAVSFEV
jgi:hypothetical protein